MHVLDTNHLRELCYESVLSRKLLARTSAPGVHVVTSIVSVEEAMRGWLARIAAHRECADQVWPYGELEKLLALTTSLIRLPWDGDAAIRFNAFRKQGVRIGTMDLKIACIALEHDATLLTRNTSDFAKVPGLRFENWLD